MSPAEIVARQVMLHDTCGCTVDGKRVTCDSPALEGRLDPYGEPLRWDECRCNERASSILAALEAAGFVIAPVEPTEAMKVEGGLGIEKSMFEDCDPLVFDGAVKCYHAMIAARPR